MLSFSDDYDIHEWETRSKENYSSLKACSLAEINKTKDEYYEKKKAVIENDLSKDIIIDCRDTEYIW